IFGLTMLLRWLGQKNAPNPVAYAHGLFAVTGLVLLILYSVNHPDHFPKISIILFAVAAVAGLYMFIRNFGGQKSGPLLLAIVHALVAVTSFVALLLFAFA
ncbi:MAG TPA: hypothetical protein VJ508_05190, partial [Saprospiraceae bacterium]|nr:hypothetical protein [Saprospiraceae bacterium]